MQGLASSFSHTSDEMHSITLPSTLNNDSINIIHQTESGKSCNLIVFEKELSDFIFLILKLHNRQHYIHIREFQRNVFSREKIPTKSGIIVDMNRWHEFQFKFLAFNLSYKGSPFIATSIILV